MSQPINLPQRNNTFVNNDCFYIVPANNIAELQKVYERKTTQEANNLRLQYFSIENELLNSFRYVNPVTSNLNTSSVKFATIIREASNIFEQVSRIIYGKLFRDYGNINIYNYLTLDIFLDLNNTSFYCPNLSVVSSENPTLLNPFHSLNGWDKSTKPELAQRPGWWNAYNEIKHSPDSLTVFSTLQFAIQSLLASYIMINKYLGPGVISGTLAKPEDKNGEIIQHQITVEQSKLYIDHSTLFGIVL